MLVHPPTASRALRGAAPFPLVWGALVAFLILTASGETATVAPLSPQPPIVIPRAVGYFDYMLLDSQHHRLIVSHTASQAVAFVNTDAGSLERQLYIGAAPHGIAIDKRQGTYYVGTSGAQHAVFEIDSSTLRIRGSVHTPGPIDALAFDSRRSNVYADADDGDAIWVISTQLKRIVATIHTPRDSDKIEYDPQTDRLYQNFTTTNSVMVIDPASYRALATWSTLPAMRPHGLALDDAFHELFIAGVNGKLVRLDIRSGRVLSALDVAEHVDQIAIDTARRRLYCASADGILSVVDVGGSQPRLLANVSVPHGARTLAVNLADGSVWISYGTDRDDYVMRLLPRGRP